jgi:hypothetical protein
MDTAVAYVNELSDIIPHDNSTVATLNEACGQEIMSILFPALDDLNQQLGKLQNHIQQLADTVSCHQISPLFRRISHGAMCTESPFALTVLWSCSLVLCILSLVMLTTRAALYNAVRHKKPRQKKPRRVVEKEFTEYQDFMKQYYDDTDQWKLDDPLPTSQEHNKDKKYSGHQQKASKICLDFDSHLDQRLTFETAISSSPTTSEEDEQGDDNGGNLEDGKQRRRRRMDSKLETASDIGGIHQQSLDGTSFEEDDSYGSEYDSEISDENIDDDDGGSKDCDSMDDEQSAVMSFLSETRSIAMQTLQSLQKIKPLLASINPMLAPRFEHDESQDDDMIFSSQKDRKVIHDKVEDSVYVATESICDPPTTPGLHPVPKPMRDKNKHQGVGEAMDDDSSISHSFTPVYDSLYTRIDGFVRDKDGKGRVLGRSVRHLPQRRSNRTNRQHASVPGFNGPHLMDALTTPSSVISALTPLAPFKPFSFLYRTKNDEEHFDDLYHDDDGKVDIFQDKEGSCDGDEAGRINVQTPKQQQQQYHRRDGMSFFSLSPDVDSIRPTKLEMSPLLMPVQMKNRPPGRDFPHSRSRRNEKPNEPPGKFSVATTGSTVRSRRKPLYRDELESDSEATAGIRTSTVQQLVRRYDRKPTTEIVSVRHQTSSTSSFPRGNQTSHQGQKK